MLSQLEYTDRRQATEHRNNPDEGYQTDTGSDGSDETVMYNPVEFTCGKKFTEKGSNSAWAWFLTLTRSKTTLVSDFPCSMVFCHQNGCNKLATGFVPGPYQFLYDLPQYLLIGILIAALVAILVFLLAGLCVTLCKCCYLECLSHMKQKDDGQLYQALRTRVT